MNTPPLQTYGASNYGASNTGAPSTDPTRSYVIGGIAPEQADHRAGNLLASRGGHLGSTAVRPEVESRAEVIAKIPKPEQRRVLETKKAMVKAPDGHVSLTLLRAGKVLSEGDGYSFDELRSQGVKLGDLDADIVERAHPASPDTSEQISALAAAIRELAARPAPAPAAGESAEMTALRAQNEQFRLANEATQRQLADLAKTVGELAKRERADDEPKGKTATSKPAKE